MRGVRWREFVTTGKKKKHMKGQTIFGAVEVLGKAEVSSPSFSCAKTPSQFLDVLACLGCDLPAGPPPPVPPHDLSTH